MITNFARLVGLAGRAERRHPSAVPQRPSRSRTVPPRPSTAHAAPEIQEERLWGCRNSFFTIKNLADFSRKRETRFVRISPKSVEILMRRRANKIRKASW